MENKEKKTLHLTLKNNETEEVLFDGDGQFFVGSFYQGKDAANIVSGEGSPFSHFITLLALEAMKEKIYEANPKLKNILEIAALIGIDKDITEADMVKLVDLVNSQGDPSAEK